MTSVIDSCAQRHEKRERGERKRKKGLPQPPVTPLTRNRGEYKSRGCNFNRRNRRGNTDDHRWLLCPLTKKRRGVLIGLILGSFNGPRTLIFNRKNQRGNTDDRWWLLCPLVEERRGVLIRLILRSFNGPRTPICDRNRGRRRLRLGVFFPLFFLDGLNGL